MTVFKTIEVFKRTLDEWYPSYQLKTANDKLLREDLVLVSFMQLDSGFWRVCAWGQDDMGLERDWPAEEERQAFTTFLQIIGWETVEQRRLIDDFNFVSA